MHNVHYRRENGFAGQETGLRKMARMTVAAACLMAGLAHANADETGFLRSLEGSWAGKGVVKIRVTSPTIHVSCKFKSTTSTNSLLLDGDCRGLLVFTRHFSASLKADGATYSGSYTGSATGPAGLKGVRQGSMINLGITWAKPVNGDRKAIMTVQKNGADGMTLTTTDIDPRTGKSVVTSRIDLKRM